MLDSNSMYASRPVAVDTKSMGRKSMEFKMHPDTEAKLLEISSQMSRSRGPSRMNTRPPSLAASRHSLHESHLRPELSKETQKGFQISDRSMAPSVAFMVPANHRAKKIRRN